MTEAATAPNPKGIFDRSTKGQTTTPVTVEVERDRIRFFAKVLGETNPIHSDLAAARALGHPDLVAPASFFTVLQASASEELARRGQVGADKIVRCDVRYLLHGDETYQYDGLIYAGDALEITTTVVDFFDRKDGALEFVTLRMEARHADRGVLVRSTRTLLHRLG